MAEVNAVTVNSWTYSRGTEDDAGLDFRKTLAIQMLENTIDHKLVDRSPMMARKM